jgi:hypothetical protein
MKAITIWQPWASLIMAGAKPYEFRSWPATRALRGQRIAIHAGARPVKRVEMVDLLTRGLSSEAWTTALKLDIALPLLDRWLTSPGQLPLSSILGTATLGEPRRAFDIVSEFGARLNDSDRSEHCNWAWPLTDIEVFKPFVPARGAQGFWDWKP